MINNIDRPVVVSVHQSLIDELKIRQDYMRNITGKKTQGGLTTFSKLAAIELKSLRLTSNKLLKEIIKNQHPPIIKLPLNGSILPFVPYEFYKKLYIFSVALRNKKDTKQITLDVSKLKGLKKNNAKIYW